MIFRELQVVKKGNSTPFIEEVEIFCPEYNWEEFLLSIKKAEDFLRKNLEFTFVNMKIPTHFRINHLDSNGEDEYVKFPEVRVYKEKTIYVFQDYDKNIYEFKLN